MALPNRTALVPQKKRLSDDALDQLSRRMAVAPAEKKSGTVTTSPRMPTEPKKPGMPAGPQVVATSPRKDTPKATTPAAGEESSLDYLSRLRADQEKVQEATKADLAAGKAKASLDAGARAGAAGMGLSGATAALQSDIGRQQDRGAVLALDELARRQNDEEFQAIGQQAAIYDFEDAYDMDMDGDGMVAGLKVGGKIGDGDPDNNPDTRDSADKPDAVRPEAGGKKKSIADMSDDEFNMLSKEQAEAAGWEAEAWLADDRETEVGPLFAKFALWVGPNGEERIVPVDDVGELMSGGLEWED